jgi:hypothetical protein
MRTIRIPTPAVRGRRSPTPLSEVRREGEGKRSRNALKGRRSGAKYVSAAVSAEEGLCDGYHHPSRPVRAKICILELTLGGATHRHFCRRHERSHARRGPQKWHDLPDCLLIKHPEWRRGW